MWRLPAEANAATFELPTVQSRYPGGPHDAAFQASGNSMHRLRLADVGRLGMSRAAAVSALPSGPAWVAVRLVSLLWPRGRPGLKTRVVAAFVLLLAAKLISIAAPLLYKEIIDALSVPAVALVPIALILVYGLAHVASSSLRGCASSSFSASPSAPSG